MVNSLNSNLPLTTPSLNGISSQQHGSSPSIPLPVSSTPPSSSTISHQARDISTPNQQDLEAILQTHANEIERDLRKFENIEEQRGVIELFEMENFTFEKIELANELVEEGLEFLDNVLPQELFNETAAYKRLEHLGGYGSLVMTFLSALDCGAQTVAFIYKVKILEKAKESLAETEAKYAQPASNSGQQTQSSPPLSDIEKAKIEKKIKEWKNQVQREEEALEDEKLKLNLNVDLNILKILNTSLVYFSESNIATAWKSAAEVGIPLAIAGLEVTLAGITLKETKEETELLHQWMESYRSWQDEHQPQFEISQHTITTYNPETGKNETQIERDIRRVRFQPTSVPPPPSDEKHKETLFKLIEETPDFSEIPKKLKAFFTIPSSITSKEQFLRYLEQPLKKGKLAESYLAFQRKLEAFNHIIHTSEDLLAKREVVRNKKVLEADFEAVKDKIKELKKRQFIGNKIQQMWESLPYSNHSDSNDYGLDYEAIKEQLSSSGVEMKEGEPLHNALEALKKSAKDKNSKFESLVKDREQFVVELKKQMDLSPYIDQEFEKVFATQTKEKLLQFYVDHQETIEQTTKNALKEMVEQKHTLESRFQRLKLRESQVKFGVAVVTLAVSATLAILGLLSLPFGGSGLVFLLLSLGTLGVSLGFLGASYYQSRYYKPHSTKLLTIPFQLKLGWTKMRTMIESYSHAAKEQKLLGLAETIDQLNKRQQEVDEKIKLQFQETREDFKRTEGKVAEWKERLNTLEDQLNRESWKDFTEYASLRIGDHPNEFDTLQAFQEALKASDLNLLSEETKTLLEFRLGIDLEVLQKQIEENPEEIKKTLQEFFILDNAELIHFIQQSRI